ncbi:hypothetical protein NQ315_005582 [Exocentrus adspersus]|uniref:Uncharacterized protein n=1 Tax=Exocentrus adspersus TaxID=1586481 RepID=A0AAV8VT87_9CUCU|nr:hypothetical protein NQ315_005582 [Exocentrus adspersus]
MALKTGINPNENLASSEIILQNQPLALYSQQNEHDLILNSLNDENNHDINLQQFVCNTNYYQFENLPHYSIQSDCSRHQSFQYADEEAQVDDGLAVLEILCGNKEDIHQPEFIDINKLSEVNGFEDVNKTDVICISDDDDVVFVKEFTGKAAQQTAVASTSTSGSTIRRNPVRQVRVRSKKLSREHILEEDFGLLDSSGDERKVPRKKTIEPAEVFKEWPVNAHERPVFNTETKKVEALDYTVSEVEKKTSFKKPRWETVPVKKKSKKKYGTRRRNPRVVVPKKIPIADLQSLVNSTTEMLKDFFVHCKESRALLRNEDRNADVCNPENSLEIFKTQVILFSLVNDLDQNEVLKKLDVNDFNKNEAKE